MFDELVVSGQTGEMARTHKPWSVGVSMILEAGILGALLLIPLIYTQTLPTSVMNTFLVAPPPPAPPPPPQAVVKQAPQKTFAVNHMEAPTVIPKQIEVAKDEAPPSVAPSDTAGVAGGTGDVLGGIGTGAAPPPPPIGLAIMFGQQKYTQVPAPILSIVACPHDFGDDVHATPEGKAAIVKEDGVRCTAQADAFQSGIPSAHIVRLRNADHYVFKSNEADTLREMNAFIATLPGN